MNKFTTFLKAQKVGILIDALRNVKVSTDGQKLTFGYIHNGQYGPIVYKLEKVAE